MTEPMEILGNVGGKMKSGYKERKKAEEEVEEEKTGNKVMEETEAEENEERKIELSRGIIKKRKRIQEIIHSEGKKIEGGEKE